MMTQFTHDMYFFSAELTLLIGALVALMAGTFGKNPERLTSQIAVAALVVALGFLFCVPANGDMSFGLHFVQTEITRYGKILAILASLGGIALAPHALRRVGAWRFEFPVLILLATLGMCLMISARDFMALYVGLELQSLSLYILASFARDNARATEAGLKYFVLGALSSGMLLYGMSLLYGATGSVQYDTLHTFIAAGTPSMGVTLALVFMTAAFCFKISAAPFHMWTPDVYQGAATPVTAFFTTAPKIAGTLVLAQLLYEPLAGAFAAWSQILWAAAALSLCVGGFAALMQTNIKRLLAYSTINHVGFLLIAILASGEAGMASLLVYLAVYIIISLGTFGAILLLQQQGETAEEIKDLTGLGKRRPRIAISLAVLMFAAAGVPPTAGFLGKMFVLMAAMNAGLIWLAVLGVITSVVATFYYLRIIKVMYFDDAPALVLPQQKPSRRLVALLSIMTALTLVLMFIPGLVVDPAITAARTYVMSLAR